MDDEQRRAYHAIGNFLGSKWTFHVLDSLAADDHGFNALRRSIGGITAKTLSARLSELRCLGFVEKEVHATSPPSTTYSLTEAGRELLDVVAQVETAVELIDCREGDCAVTVGGSDECAVPLDAADDCACEC